MLILSTLQRELGRLVEAELVYQWGLPPHATYTFKHALIQDTAYESLLRSTRQGCHQRIAEVLAAHFPETVENQPELLAHHYAEAGLNEQAVDCWHQAGQHASKRSAYVEAIAHLTKGLEALKDVPERPSRYQLELHMQTCKHANNPGPGVDGHTRMAAPEVQQTYARARVLCQQVEETPQLFSVLWGLWHLYLIRGELQTAEPGCAAYLAGADWEPEAFEASAIDFSGLFIVP